MWYPCATLVALAALASPFPVEAPVEAPAEAPLELPAAARQETAVLEAPTPSQVDAARIDALLKQAHAKFAGVAEGANADYIPVLAEVDPKLFGIALVTPDGTVHSVGDVEHLFSIQSISKVFNLARVMVDSGPDTVLEKIGVNATGQPFNSVIAVEIFRDRAVNPFVNAGAIATASLVLGDTEAEKWGRMLGTMNDFAGRELVVDQVVYDSESATNQRNQAIAMLLASHDRMYDDPLRATDLYTRGCSVSVNTIDLAVMGATLANGGENPRTNKQVIPQQYVGRILAVMSTAGMYDQSGTWLWNVGLPAKSGVGGGILAVAPGRFGIAAFSPPLDEAGNSIRAQLAIDFLVEGLHASPFESEAR